jgi:hypothetical protein
VLAEAAALEAGYLTLPDALALVALYTGAGDRKFEKAAVRWLGRPALERDGVTLGEMVVAAAAMAQLSEHPEPAAALLRRLAGVDLLASPDR